MVWQSHWWPCSTVIFSRFEIPASLLFTIIHNKKTEWKLLVDTFQGGNGCLQPLDLISLRCLSKRTSILRRSEYDFSR